MYCIACVVETESETGVRVSHVAGIDDGEDVDTELLTGIYERVRVSEFQPSADHVLQVVKVEQMILGKKPVCTPIIVAVDFFCLPSIPEGT